MAGNVHIDEDTHKKLKTYKKQTGIEIQRIVDFAINEYLDKKLKLKKEKNDGR